MIRTKGKVELIEYSDGTWAIVYKPKLFGLIPLWRLYRWVGFECWSILPTTYGKVYDKPQRELWLVEAAESLTNPAGLIKPKRKVKPKAKVVKEVNV